MKGKRPPLATSMAGTRSPFSEVRVLECFILDDNLTIDGSGDDGAWATAKDPSVPFSAVLVRRSGAAFEVFGVKTLRLVCY